MTAAPLPWGSASFDAENTDGGRKDGTFLPPFFLPS